MTTYRDGDSRYTLIRPGDTLPGEYRGPAQGNDFSWINRSLLQRWRGTNLGKALKILNNNLGLSIEYNNQTAAYELSRQAIIHARNQAALLPLKIEEERSERELHILRTHAAMQDEVERRERAQREHKRRIMELKGERKSAKSRNKQAKRARRRGREAERQQPAYDTPPPSPPYNGAEAFRRHYEAHQDAADSLAEGRWQRHEIYARAEAERRNLTEDDLLKLDAIDDAARAGADEMRRTRASDLPPEGGRR